MIMCTEEHKLDNMMEYDWAATFLCLIKEGLIRGTILGGIELHMMWVKGIPEEEQLIERPGVETDLVGLQSRRRLLKLNCWFIFDFGCAESSLVRAGFL